MTMSEVSPTPASLNRVLAIFLPIACQAGEERGGVVSFISLLLMFTKKWSEGAAVEILDQREVVGGPYVQLGTEEDRR